MAVVNFFPAFAPPRSGGEMRYWHLYSRLSQSGFRVRMVNPTYPFVEEEAVEHNPEFTEIRVPKTMMHHRLHQVLGRVLGQGECSAAVVALAARFHSAFLARAREAIAKSEIVMLDYPLPLGALLGGKTAPLTGLTRGGTGGGAFLVYNSYNVERTLLRETLRGPAGWLIASWIGRYEKDLCRRADVIFACSHEDADELATRYGLDPTKIYIVPNGVDTKAIQPVAMGDAEARGGALRELGLDAGREMVLFLGSQHPPNLEAGNFLIREIAPRLPEAQFVIAGSVCGGLSGEVPANVRLFGKFENSVKPALLQGATVAVNPLFSGSGTNLKMLEFMAAGLPVVATPFGARGLLARDGEHLCLAEAGEFATTLTSLLGDSEMRGKLARAGRELVCERFDWDRIAEDAAQVLRHKTRNRILVLNDYPVAPVTFGGKVRLFNHYKAVAAAGFNVTILTQTNSHSFARRALARGVEEINVPQNLLYRLARPFAARLIGVAADDLVAYLTVRRSGAMREAVRREARFARTVVVSHPYLVPLARDLAGKTIVYESHNVEADLKRKMYDKGFWGRWGQRRVRRCEAEAIRQAEIVTACSEENHAAYRKLYPAEIAGKRAIVTSNGVDCGAHRPAASLEERRVLKRRLGFGDEVIAAFLGSGHPPNVEAGRFVMEELAPRHPEVVFLILGSVCWALRREGHPQNVVMFYHLTDEEKNRLLAATDIALNPLTTGSGTSLKILDYLAAGAAVLTTVVGARGVGITDGVDGVVCDLEEFSGALEKLAGDAAGRHAMGARGVELAREKYDWGVTAGGILEELKKEEGQRTKEKVRSNE